MRLDQTGSANGDRPSPNGSKPCLEPETLQAKCRRQALVIDRLSEVVSTLHRGAKALKEENSELRSENERLAGENERLAGGAGLDSGARCRMDDGGLVEVPIALDVQAPGAARTVVSKCLDERVVPSALDNARLLVSELVSNSLQHGGGQAGDPVVVSVELMPGSFRVGVQDSGSDAIIAARPASVDTASGFGLNVVRLLSERWGVERLAKGGTQVWAQLPRAPLADVGAPRSGLATQAA